MVVVVCRDGRRQVGIAVSQVLDVAPGSDLFEAGTGERTGGVTQLNNRVTGLVDLGAVQDLPVVAAAVQEEILDQKMLEQNMFEETVA